MKYIFTRDYLFIHHLQLDMKRFNYIDYKEFCYWNLMDRITKSEGDIISTTMYCGEEVYIIDKLHIDFNYYYKEYCMPLSLYREQRINEILNEL